MLKYFLTLLILWLSPLQAKPVFDMHTHYKWSQRENTSPEQAIKALDAANISHAVVIGKPPKLALEVKELALDRIVAFFSPYRDSLDWFRWQYNEKVLEEATQAIESGQYQGIGELHIIGGFSAKKSKAKVLNGLLDIFPK